MLAEYTKHLGAHGMLTMDKNFHIGVRVIDIRLTYGLVQAKVTPEMGAGSVWVTLDRINFDKPKAEGGSV